MKHLPAKVLAVDDEEAIRKLLQAALSRAGFAVKTAASAEEALQRLKEDPAEVVLLDVRMPGKTGTELLPEVTAQYPETSVIMLTAVGDTETAISCMRAGAFDYILKPFEIEHLAVAVKRAAHRTALLKERLRLTKLQDDLTHMIIHDIRNELTPILSVLELVSSNSHLDAKEQKFLRVAQDATMRLANMTNGLLDVAKLERGEMPIQREEVALSPFLSEIEEFFTPQASSRKIQLKVHTQAELRGSFDRELIRRVLFNLIQNAFKFTPPEGRIAISAEEKESAVCLTVSDTGPGIPVEYQSRIFEKFTSVELKSQGERRGVGLGLTFCKLAVEAHGGNIQVFSQEGKGASFTFTLPQTKTS